jgi:hypothetical protein
MSHHHKNFAYSTIVTAPSPASSGTTLTVQAGDGLKFPDVPFNATVWPVGVQPISTNAEIVVVTDKHDDLFTIERSQESSSARSIVVGDQIAATITAKTLTDAEDDLPFWSPFVLASGNATGLQTLASNRTQNSTGSLLVFPVTVPSNMLFNQVIILNSLSGVSSAAANTANNSYSSKFGIYSMNANTLSLISSNSFSIGESIAAAGITWNYPTTTHTSGYGYGGFPSGNLTNAAQQVSYVNGIRSIGLQFGGDVRISGGVYWLAIMSQKISSVATNVGLNHAGIIGQPINVINQVGTSNGLNPMGIAATRWSLNVSNITGWWGRHIVGFITNTALANFGGTVIPASFALGELGAIAAASTVTILPTVTFVST